MPLVTRDATVSRRRQLVGVGKAPSGRQPGGRASTAAHVQMLPSGVAAAIRGRRHVAGVAGGARERRPVCGGAPHRERQVVNEDDAAHRKRHVVDDLAEACRRLQLFNVVARDTRGRRLTAGATVVSRPLGAVDSDAIDGRQRLGGIRAAACRQQLKIGVAAAASEPRLVTFVASTARGERCFAVGGSVTAARGEQAVKGVEPAFDGP
mgnify:CR=1 FL=1